MSAGFKVVDEVFWGTNGAVEAYVEALATEAAERFGADSPLAIFFKEEQENFFTGAVVVLDSLLEDVTERQCFVDVLDAATARLLRGDTFTDHGRKWVASVIPVLRGRVATGVEATATSTEAGSARA